MLVSHLLVRDRIAIALGLGVATALVLMIAFLVFQQWRYSVSAPQYRPSLTRTSRNSEWKPSGTRMSCKRGLRGTDGPAVARTPTGRGPATRSANRL